MKANTFLTGLSTFIHLTDEPARYGNQIVNNMLARTVPAVSGAVARATDDNVRDARSILDTVKSRIPGVSQTLPEKLTVWGEPIKRQGNAATRLLSPIPVSTERGDDLDRELVKLKVDVGYPGRTITRKGEKIELNPEQYKQLVELSGKAAKEHITRIMNSGKWDGYTDEHKGDLIKSVVRKYRALAARQILNEYKRKVK